MSIESAKAFFDKIDSDPELQKEVREAHAELLGVARKHGHDFSQADMNQHLRERWGVKQPPSYDDVDITTAG